MAEGRKLVRRNELALVVMGVADDNDHRIGRHGDFGGPVGIAAIIEIDRCRGSERAPNTFQRRHHMNRVGIARAAIARIRDLGQTPDHRQALQRPERQQITLVLEEDDALFRYLARNRTMGVAADEIGRIGRRIAPWPKRTCWRSTRKAASSIRASGTSPRSTSPFRCWPKSRLKGISISWPASAAVRRRACR